MPPYILQCILNEILFVTNNTWDLLFPFKSVTYELFLYVYILCNIYGL